MKLIICTDTRLGYSFNNRRQTSDREVHRHMADRLLERGIPLYINQYSRRSVIRSREYLPPGFLDEVVRSGSKDDEPGAFLDAAIENGAFAFVENVPLTGLYHNIDEIMMYTWDKRYPADLLIPYSLLSSFDLVEEETFMGHSHEGIVFRHYVKKITG